MGKRYKDFEDEPNSKAHFLRYRACERKIRYATFDEALDAARSLRRRKHSKRAKGSYPYRCPYGNHYHVAGGRRRKRKAL